ncbi:MAG: UDPGP type 1 family protein [Phycisphaerae bacterium]|nr:UDPGP type 1 family protein [Phycisphaerae bacterium]
MSDLAAEYRLLKSAFDAVEQGHVFTFWTELAEDERRILLDDLKSINLTQLPGVAALAQKPDAHAAIPDDLTPAEVIPRESVGRDTIRLGEKLLEEGRVAAFTVAGGQGTRLGFDGPKGALPVSTVRGKTLFQLFAESILATERRYRTTVPWYIMTSPANDAQTQAFLRRYQFFGLAPDRVRFFQQGVMPSFDSQGKILLDQRNRVALSPDGHGGSLLAMATSGVLADMAARGVDYISYFQVDNPLVFCLDPVFIGLHAAGGAEMSSKIVPKADDLEKVGNFATSGGKQIVIEYSDMPESVARSRNPDGSRRFDAANIAIHILSRSFVERLTADRASFALPWHIARKKIPFVDPSTGGRVEPLEPNGVKIEAFVFDALPLARAATLLRTSRENEFSPVKNKTGVDSIETARRDMSRRAENWLLQAGLIDEHDANAMPPVACEISALAALDAAELAERARRGMISVHRIDHPTPAIVIDA